MAHEWTPPTQNDQQMTIAWIFFAAISIYLSGIYDYCPIWVDNGISTPSLGPMEVRQHVASILDITSSAVERQNLASLLFLFPLRIAGARASHSEQKLQIQGLLLKIAGPYRAANAFLADLEDLWADPTSYHNR